MTPMNLMRNPWSMFDEMRNEMAQMWNRPLFDWPMKMTTEEWMPTTDVYREKGHLMVKADLPGMTKDDLEVALDNGDLVLKGERKAEKKVEKEDFYHCERSYGQFLRRIPLPFHAEAGKVKANFKDGVLEVKIPIPKEADVTPQKIAVH
jgi:HSP20 family protein